MNRQEFEVLGTKQKAIESKFKHYLIDDMYTVVRLDGRAFHTFTRGLKKPFDDSLIECMENTTKALIKQFHASLGYTQSDEITLVFSNKKELPFGGVYSKILSTTASYASSFFIKQVSLHLPQKVDMVPTFDSRVVQYAHIDGVLENLLWRETDATRNSLSMLAQANFSQKQLHGKGRKAIHDMLHGIGVNWNDLPDNKKRGSYFYPTVVEKHLSEDELKMIPEKHRPTGPVMRGLVDRLCIHPMEKIVSGEHQEDYNKILDLL